MSEIKPRKKRTMIDILASSDEEDDELIAGIESPPPSALTLGSDSSPGQFTEQSPELATQPLATNTTKRSNTTAVMDSLAGPVFTLSKKSSSQSPSKDKGIQDTKGKENQLEVINVDDSPVKPQSEKKRKSKSPEAEHAEPRKSEKKSTKASPKSTPKTKVNTNVDARPEEKAKKKSKRSKEDDPPKEDSKPAAKTSEKAERSPAKSQEPPTKKAKKMTFQDKVFNYMLMACKPFTLKSLAEPLKTTDTALNHLMLSLVDKGLVVTKDFEKKGRVKTLYWANHDGKSKEVAASMASAEERKRADRELADLQAEQAALNQALNTTGDELSNAELERTLKEEEAELAKLQSDLEKMKLRIRNAKAGQPKPKFPRGPPKSEAQLAKERCPRRLTVRINNMRDEWKKRKDKCIDFIDVLADGMEKKPKEVFKLLEIETDEDCGVKLPPKREIQ